MGMPTFKEYLFEKKFDMPSRGESIYDVDGKKIGSVKSLSKDTVTMSNGDEVNADSFFKDGEKWVAEL